MSIATMVLKTNGLLTQKRLDDIKGIIVTDNHMLSDVYEMYSNGSNLKEISDIIGIKKKELYDIFSNNKLI